jgi:lysophospholipase L1-like esterase
MIKTGRGLLVAACLTVTGAAVGLPTTAVAQSQINYVALGDSYAAGVGELGFPFTYPSSPSCSRSHKGYVQMLGAELGASWYFKACGGAKAIDRGSFDIPGYGNGYVQSVRDDQLGALNSATDLVTLTVGGNDIGFAFLVIHCIALPNWFLCDQQISQSKSDISNKLAGKLNTLYAEIHNRAPNSLVAVTGYPRPFAHSYWWDAYCPAANHLSYDRRNKLNTLVDQLNGQIAAAASASGFIFVDPNPYFSGHGVCSSDPYLRHMRDWVSSGNGNIANVAHPNAKGYREGYLRAFQAQVGF